MTDKEKIRNIIELFIAWNGETDVIDVANIDSAVDFIADSLQEEPVSNELNSFAEEYSFNIPSDIYNLLPKEKQASWIIEIENAIKAGAKWQKEQDDKLPNIIDKETLDEYAYQVAYDLSNDWMKDNPTWDDVEAACKLGAKWKKEQLMKNAVEGGCFSYKNGYYHIFCDIDEHLTDIKMGDKVKLIIIKDK